MKRRFRSADRQRVYTRMLTANIDREIFVERTAIAVQDNPIQSVLHRRSLKAVMLG